MAENEPEVQEAESIRIPLSDKHCELLGQQFNALRGYYSHLGSMLCDMLENYERAKAMRKSITTLQEDICRELKVPRSDKTYWDLTKKCIEIPDAK